ncbi:MULTISPECIES: hypothetical protein [unclassified Rhizobium]|uniref:hypothetical protein n=1 Tax=unclassified Rhizobium TaxID=2613769 RepID=UPI00104B7D45|nr:MULTISPECIES: hypothetical protein [unclassified Rhizobium]MBB4170056.1 hypothetical protein [Rhizobium sp. BK538]TCM72197.1 hypothetical protein EV291_12063 [Rhizobium sp. BK068]
MKVDRFTTLIFAAGFAMTTAAFAQDAPKKPHVPLERAIGQVTPTGPVPSLAVINSAGAKIENGKLVLTGVSANSIVFADRPVRAAGHVTTEQFIMQWDDGKDNFAVDPPNATVSVLGGGSDVSDAVVTLKTPKLDGTTLTFDIAVLEGSLSGATGPAALFIDHFGGSFGGGGFGGFHGGGLGGGSFGGGGFRGGDFAGGDFRGGFRGDDVHIGDTNINRVGGTYWHAPVYHGAWYRGAPVAAGVVAGAAIGAAAARPYYPYYNSYDNNQQCGYYPYPPCY